MGGTGEQKVLQKLWLPRVKGKGETSVVGWPAGILKSEAPNVQLAVLPCLTHNCFVPELFYEHETRLNFPSGPVSRGVKRVGVKAGSLGKQEPII